MRTYEINATGIRVSFGGRRGRGTKGSKGTCLQNTACWGLFLQAAHWLPSPTGCLISRSDIMEETMSFPQTVAAATARDHRAGSPPCDQTLLVSSLGVPVPLKWKKFQQPREKQMGQAMGTDGRSRDQNNIAQF